jgi:hypothetical protein
MRAWEFISESRNPPSKPITLRVLHHMKLEQKRRQATEKERRILMQAMYSDSASEQESIDLERQRLELEQLRAEILSTNVDTTNKSAMVIHTNARSGIKSAEKQKHELRKKLKSGIGRILKP